MDEHFEFSLQSSDGLTLFGQGWEPASDPRAVVCLVHGLGEHSSRYAHLAKAIGDAGYAMVAIDLRGHGKSSGKRGHFQSYELVLDDLSLLIEDSKRRFPGLPTFLYGHSLGGGMVLNYALRKNTDLSGIIATGPTLRLGFDPPAIKVALGRGMNRFWPAFAQPSGLDTKALSRDPEVVQNYVNDPLVHDRASSGLFVGFYEAGIYALEHAAGFPLPLLLMHGSKDMLTSPKASEEFAASMGDKCTLKIWDGFYHEIHNEPEKEQVFDLIIEWLNQCMG